MKLKQGWNENVPLELAKKLIVTESPFVEYLHKKKVLKRSLALKMLNLQGLEVSIEIHL